MNVKALKECLNIIDQVNVMAYDAGKSYDSIAAFKAYRSLYPGIINIGFLIGKPGWGDALLFKPELLRVSQEVSKDKLSGCFFWVYTFLTLGLLLQTSRNFNHPARCSNHSIQNIHPRLPKT